MEAVVKFLSLAVFYAFFCRANGAFSNCDRIYQKVGCYSGKAGLDQEIVNYRVQKPGGNVIDWGNYPGTLHSLACECEKIAKGNGWTHFGITYYGVCVSGASFNADAAKSDDCIAHTYGKCSDSELQECSGTGRSTYVFKAAEADTGVCSKSLDIGIAIDSSSSIYQSDWEHMKSFLGSFVDSVKIGQSNVKISVMSFSSAAQIEIKFADSSNADELKAKIKQLNYIGGFTRTDLALKLAKDLMFQSSNGARSDAKKIFVVLTDGAVLGRDATINWSDSIINPAKELKDSGVEVFSGGIGADVSQLELETLSSTPTAEHLLIIKDFTNLAASAPRLSAMTCGAKFENVALNRPTEQSSTLGQYYGKSAHAVDGNSNNRIYGASCTRTNNEANPWWRVDLEQERNVFEVKVVNRGDCCGSYLTGFQVRIGNSMANNGNDNSLCDENIPITTGETKRVICKEPIKGRYVNIRIPAQRTLTLCEVEVIAKV